jgi:uncharacterized protein (TIGR02996 family)
MTSSAALDGQALLQAILDNPGWEDDLSRLAYADWLDENDQPERAEFIRLQIAHEWYPGGPMESFRDGRSQEELAKEESRLLLAHSYQWIGCESVREVSYEASGNCGAFAVVVYFDDNARFRVRCHRGFASHIECTQAAWLSHGPTLVQKHPVQEVKLTRKHPENGADCFYWWFSDVPEVNDEPAVVARCLYDSLPRYTPQGLSQSELEDYDPRGRPTRDEAIDALSVACLRWANIIASRIPPF